MIGNREDAEFICDHVRTTSDDTELPDGWSLLGEGGFRYAYLSPDDVVYKVNKWAEERQGACRDHWGNRREADNLEHLADRPGITFGLPAHTLYELDNGEFVMAMEFIASSGRGVSSRQRDMIRQADGVFTDMHPGNYILRASHDDIVVVDAGCMLMIEVDTFAGAC